MSISMFDRTHSNQSTSSSTDSSYPIKTSSLSRRRVLRRERRRERERSELSTIRGRAQGRNLRSDLPVFSMQVLPLTLLRGAAIPITSYYF